MDIDDLKTNDFAVCRGSIYMHLIMSYGKIRYDLIGVARLLIDAKTLLVEKGGHDLHDDISMYYPLDKNIVSRHEIQQILHNLRSKEIPICNNMSHWLSLYINKHYGITINGKYIPELNRRNSGNDIRCS